MDNTAFKVLKLRSGDDIIAQLIKNTKEFFQSIFNRDIEITLLKIYKILKVKKN